MTSIASQVRGLFAVGGELVLWSEYSDEIVAACRAIPGRRWEREDRSNRFPLASIRPVRELCERFDIPQDASAAAVPDMELVVAPEDTPGVTVVGNRLYLRFPGHPKFTELVGEAKVLPGAFWKAREKAWIFPMSSMPDVVRFAAQHGIDVPKDLLDQARVYIEQYEANLDASRATSAEFNIDSAIELLPYQKAGVVYMLKQRRCILADQPGVGKFQPVTEPVLTPRGWRPIGDIRVGDEVIGVDGRPTEVVGVFPQGIQEVVRIEFNDGTWTECGWDHLWTVHARGKWQTVTTRQMFKGDVIEHEEATGDGLRMRRTYTWSCAVRDKSRGGRRLRIPMVAPVEYPEADLPVDPYLLGVALGDGAMGGDSPKLCLNGDDAREIAEAIGKVDAMRPVPGRNSVDISLGRAMGRLFYEIGVTGRSWEKSVPREYLHASIPQRLALLQGLMDTDGSALPDGGTEFSSTAEALADAVVELVESLGGVARKKGPRRTTYTYKGERKLGRPSWRVNAKLPPEFNPFRIERKMSAWVRPTKYPPNRLIDNIVPTGRHEESVCIRVANDDGLYVTRHHIVTHNTAQALSAVVAEQLFPAVVIAPKSLLPNWRLEASKFFPGLPVTIVSGSKPGHIDAAPGLVLINYDICSQRANDLIALKPQALVVDEAHAIRNGKAAYYCPHEDCGLKVRVNSKRCPDGHRFVEAHEKWTVKRTEGVLRVAQAIPRDGIVALLTGTPFVNRPSEIIAPLIVIDKLKEFGGRYRFTQRYCDGGNGASNMEELARRMRETCLIRRTKADIYDELPPLRHAKQYLDVPADARKKYQEAEDDVANFLAQRAAKIAAEAGEDPRSAYWEKFMRVQSAEHLVRFSALKTAVADLKYGAVEAWLDEWLEENEGEKILVFAERIAILDKLEAHFGPEMCRKIRGDVSMDDRARAVTDFQTDPKVRVFLGSLMAATEGVTLTAASNVFFAEQAWNFSTHFQALSRAYARAGDMHGTTCYWGVVEDTIDEEIHELLLKKEDIVARVTEGEDVERQSSILADLVVQMARRGMTRRAK